MRLTGMMIRCCYQKEPDSWKRSNCKSKHETHCPSCKLILNLLHYVAQNGEAIYEGNFTACQTYSITPPLSTTASNELRNKERRKMAIIALLSHWQTLICNEVQLADNILAQKYKYNANRRASSVLQSGHPDNNVVCSLPLQQKQKSFLKRCQE
uniref:Uncharacterized protein n=1 Tax=Ditylenchus dipsaci TaxID=166011 RepID=A0A915E9A3_9BILA